MAKKWAEVAQSKEFKALPPTQQEQARNDYFREVVVPNVPTDQVPDVRAQFDADTKATVLPVPVIQTIQAGKTPVPGQAQPSDNYWEKMGRMALNSPTALIPGISDISKIPGTSLSQNLIAGYKTLTGPNSFAQNKAQQAQREQQIGQQQFQQGVGNAVQQGATFGFSDEIKGRLNQIASKLQGGNLSYQDAVKQQRDAMDKFAKENPGTAMTAEIAGSLIPGVLSGGTGFIGEGAGLGARAVGTVAEAATQGGLMGAGKATEGNRLSGAAGGALTGAVLGGVGTGLGAAGSKIISGLKENPLATMFQALDSEAGQKAEKGFAQSILGGSLRKKYEQQAGGILSELQGATQNAPQSIEELAAASAKVGKAGETAVKDIENNLYNKQVYDYLPKKTDTIVNPQMAVSKIDELMQKANTRTVKSFLQRTKEDLLQGNMSIDSAVNFKREIGKQLEKEGLDTGIAGKVYDSLRQDIRNTVSQNAPKGMEQQLVNNLDAANANGAMLRMPGGVKDTLKNLASQDANDRMSATLRLINSTQTGSKSSINELKQIKDALPPEVWNNYRQGILRNFGVTKGGSDMGNTTAFYNRLKGLKPEARDLFFHNPVTGENEENIYMGLQRKLKDLKNVPLNPSGTAQAVQDMQAGFSIPGVAGQASQFLPVLGTLAPEEKGKKVAAGIGGAAGMLGIGAMLANPKYAARAMQGIGHIGRLAPYISGQTSQDLSRQADLANARTMIK